MALGYYAVIQYVEDIERREPLNVGVIGAYEGAVDLSFTDPPDVRDPGVIHRFRETLEYVFQHEVDLHPGAEARVLDELAHRRFSMFVITPPRPVEIGDALISTLDEIRSALSSGTHTAYSA
jgi:hypothetical protein